MPAATGTKRALSIGIDAYEKIRTLDGCVNDVRLMRQLLVDVFGFDPSNMTLLTNDEATRVNILTALDALVDATQENDIVVIHYAGHGSQMTDLEGDEPSGLDSTIMPVNSEGWSGDNHDITDDEIHLRLLKLAMTTNFITLIFDCCHSGTITRDAFGGKARSAPADRRPPEELRVMRRRLGIELMEKSEQRKSGPSGILPLSRQYMLISGCRDEEESFEHRPEELGGETAHGALTWFLTNELRRASPGTTYRDVFERAAVRVTAANGRQHPQMEGAADREIFGIRDFEPMRFLRVTKRSGKNVTLSAGAAFGVTVGSRYAIHAQTVKNTEGVEPLGEVEVKSVQATTAEAAILTESAAGSIVENARAFETEHAFGDFRLAVEIVGAPGFDADVAKLRAQLEPAETDGKLSKPTSIRVVGPGEGATLRVYLLAPRDTVTEDAPVPQLGALSDPTWVVIREDGELAAAPKKRDQRDDIVFNLEQIARYRLALALDNPNADSSLRGKFRITMLRVSEAGEVTVAEPDPETNQIGFETGDLFSVRVTSEHDKPVFPTLLDFGLSGAIGLLSPGKETLREGGQYDMPEAWELGFPANYPYAEDPVHGGAAEGIETIKLIITVNEADFSFLEQSGTRGQPVAGRPPTPLEMLVRTAALGNPTRDAGKPRPIKPKTEAEDWTTVVQPFVLRRRSSAQLSADGEPVRVGTIALKTPGLEGEARVHAERGRAAAASMHAGGLVGALEAEGVELRQAVELANTRETGPASRSARGAPVMEVEIADPGPGRGQMLMTTDADGVVSWHFAGPPEPVPGARGAAARGATRRYAIPRPEPAAAPPAPGTRGLIAGIGRKLLKELVFPLIDPVIGAVTESFANRWEKKNRPYGVRMFAPDDYTRAVDYSGGTQGLDGEGWRRLSAGRALLLVHGTFSRAHSAFGAMPREFVESLHSLYDGRVFALDHPTLSEDPKQNVNWLLDRLPGDVALNLDILCHSRGGLVGRVLSEKQSELSLGSRSVRVGRVVFAGSPNAGTILADGSHIGDLIDTYTNIANFIPEIGASDVIAGVITVAKQIAVGAIGGLKGLQSMRPAAEVGQWLNAGDRAGDTRYFALSSDYTPAEPGFANFAKNRLMDFIFKGPNDLVVPTNGVFEENGSGWFPIEDRHVFSGGDGVAHTAFFASRAARDRI
ncbi:MAG: caspase family protein, partial [Gemmatimonadetes bacterium]|nr:caspase family protein [Gemmatimonadota bacterium]